jgi:uncharacterized protein YodC (DUF2158 family)
MRLRFVLAALVLLPGAAWAQGAAAADQTAREMTSAERARAFSACVRLGVPPVTQDMADCVSVSTGGARLQVADYAKAGSCQGDLCRAWRWVGRRCFGCVLPNGKQHRA